MKIGGRALSLLASEQVDAGSERKTSREIKGCKNYKVNLHNVLSIASVRIKMLHEIGIKTEMLYPKKNESPKKINFLNIRIFFYMILVVN